MSRKSKLIAATAIAVLTTAIAVLGLGSQAFAKSSSSCSGQIANLQQQMPLNLHPQTIEGLIFSGDLTRAGALDAEGDNTGCLLALHRAEQDLRKGGPS
jgi:hypothetical protein